MFPFYFIFKICFTTDQSPYIHNVAPIPPPKRKPTAADIAEKRILKVVDAIDRITGGLYIF